MKKYVAFLDKIEMLVWNMVVYEFEPATIYEAFLNVIVIKPIQNMFGFLLCVAVICWALTGCGIILIIGYYGEGNITVPLILLLFNIIYLLKYIFSQVLKFKEK